MVKQWSYVVTWGRSPASTTSDNEEPQKKSYGAQLRVKQRQREGTEPNKGTVRDRKGESSRIAEKELLTGTLEHRRPPQYRPSRIVAVTREGNTLPIPCKHDQATCQMRYVFAYAMDGTDLPRYILWPIRTEDNSFWCLDAWKGDWVQLDRCGFMAPVGIEQFFDAFSLDPKRPWRTAACQALGIPGRPHCRGYSHQPFGGKQIHAHPKMHTCWAMDNCREKQGWCDHEWWRGKWIRCW